MKNEIFDLADNEYDQGNYARAFDVFMELANLNDPSAMSRVALMYFDGDGVKRDLDQSIAWDKKAVELGCVSSLNNLAITYRMMGDIINAKKYFEKAIDAGDDDAALALAKLYMVSELEHDKIIQLLKLVTSSSNVTDYSKEQALLFLTQYN